MEILTSLDAKIDALTKKWEKRELVNAVLYLVKTGCQWRNLPHDFPPVYAQLLSTCSPKRSLGSYLT
ncbi:MAG: transposase [Selenomonadaceae bacterium]|nr:transposase [Selenomonadaceae bacterium]